MILNKLIKLAENGSLPDFMIEYGIKRLCNERLVWAKNLGTEALQQHHQEWVEKLKNSPIALVPEKANEQHYEVPPSFFELSLGKHLKYSCGFWDAKTKNLDDSEILMLEKTIERADIIDGINILPQFESVGHIDFAVQDDTAVDYLKLVVNYDDCEKAKKHFKILSKNC